MSYLYLQKFWYTFVAKSVIFNCLKCDSTLEIRCKLNMNKIMNVLDLCLDNIYLCFRKTFYRQIFGVTIGSPISVIVADLVISLLKIKCKKIFFPTSYLATLY